MTQADSNGVQEGKNLRLLSLTFSVFAIFFGIWWGLFVNSVLQAESPPRKMFGLIDYGIIKIIFVVGSPMLIGFFVYHLIKTVWRMRDFAPKMLVSGFLEILKALLSCTLVFVPFVFVPACVFPVGLLYPLYGFMLMVMWFIVSLSVIYKLAGV